MRTEPHRLFQPYFSEWLVQRYFAGRWLLYVMAAGGAIYWFGWW